MTEDEARRQEAVVEAVLFTMGKSVEIGQLAAALECSKEDAALAAERLKKRFDEEKRGVQILRFEDSYQMGTRKEYYDALIRVVKTPKKQVLSPVVLETLSIIAYKQPVTKSEISRIRGVSSDHAVNRLIEYGLVYEAGRMDAPGRPALFATTEEFLRRFGVDSASDLPGLTPDQEAEIAGEVSRETDIPLSDVAAAAERRPGDSPAAAQRAETPDGEDADPADTESPESAPDTAAREPAESAADTAAPARVRVQIDDANIADQN